MEINEAIAKLQPAVGLSLSIITTPRGIKTETLTPVVLTVHALPEDERATPEHDILLDYTAMPGSSKSQARMTSSGPKARSSRPAAS